jgi:hypothetical protein
MAVVLLGTTGRADKKDPLYRAPHSETTGRPVDVGQEIEEARTQEAGFSQQIFLRERHYADLGHLLPMFYIEPAVEPGVLALSVG